MKFPRNARIFQGRLDAAPFAAVFVLLVLLMILGSLVYTPGVPLELPVAADLPGLDKPHVSVALDANGGLYYQNQNIDEITLRRKLREASKAAKEPLTLVVQMDKAVPADRLMHLIMLGREADITSAWLATLPPAFGPAKTAARK